MDERLKEYIKPYVRRYVVGFVLLIFTNAFALLVPWILKYAIDDLKVSVTYEKLTIYAALIVGATFIQGVFRFLSRQKILKASHMVQFDILNDFFKKLLSLPMSFYDKNKTGDMISLATNDLKSVRMMVGVGILNIFNTMILASCTFMLLVMINFKLTMLVLLPFPFIALFVKRYSALLHKNYKGIQEEFANISTMVHENVSGIRVIKAYTREEDEVEEFKKLSSSYRDKNMKVVKLWGTILPLVEMLAGIGIMMVLWIGGRAVIAGTLTIGEFVAVNAYLMMLLWPMIALGWVLTLFQRANVAMGRINKIFDVVPEIVSLPDAVKSPVSGDIKIAGLNFSYGEQSPVVLKNIDLEIRKGEKVAIVGPTGSGKTTLVNIFARLYKVADDRVFINGIDINKIDLAHLRGSIGFVPQDTFLFSDTIGGNIAFGVEKVTEDDLIKFSDIADLLENINEFPESFDTYLGERGVNLSGGQRQRTSISRAMIKDPQILILDDATSNVDVHTEDNIINNLKSACSLCTIIMVSHRISTVMDFDKIIVLNEGEIEDIGTHDELIKKRGTYYSMYERYLIYKELDRQWTDY